MSQPSASAARIASSTAAWFSTGSAPGNPRHTGQPCVFGAAPNAVLQPQKILDAVRRCAWISSPMTASKSGIRTGGEHGGRHAALERAEIVDEHRREFRRLRVVVGGLL